MANEATTLLKYASLQMAAESLFGIQPSDAPGTVAGPGSMTQGSLVLGNRRNSAFPTVLAQQFLGDGWSVVEHKSNTTSGFSGTLFLYTGPNDPVRGLVNGELVLSLRSTEFVDDAARDNEATNKTEVSERGWAFGQIADLEDWWTKLNAAGGALAAGQPVTVTGYSLGAHLATAFNIIRRDKTQLGRIRATYLFNGAGVGEIRTVNGTPVTTVAALIADFERQRTNADGQQIVFSSAAVNSYFQNYLRQRFAAGTVVPTAADIVAVSDDLVAMNAPNQDASLILDALTRMRRVGLEAQRVAGLPGGSAAPAQGVPISQIAAVRLDYQIAVAVAAQKTNAGPQIAPALFGKRVPAPNGFANLFEIYGDSMPSAVAFSQYRYGEPVPVFIEDQPLYRGSVVGDAIRTSLFNGGVKLLVPGFGDNDFGDTHSLVLLVDSLAVQNTLASLDSSAELTALNAIFRSTSNAIKKEGVGVTNQGLAEGDVLERVVDRLAAMLGVATTWNPTQPDMGGNTWSKVADRNALHGNLQAIRNSGAYQALVGKVALSPVAPNAMSTIRTNARTDFSDFVALKTLSPFGLKPKSGVPDAQSALESVWLAAHGADYSTWLSDFALPGAERGNGKAHFTDAWYADRSLMLRWLLDRNEKNTQGHSIDRSQHGNYLFEDKTTGISFNLDRTTNTPTADQIAKIVFGGAMGETLGGTALADRLYGGGGIDNLSGLGGDDYLEGNAGNDTLDGGADDDTLLGGAGTDTYRFNGAWRRDTVVDADGLGSIEVQGYGTLTGAHAGKLTGNTWRGDDPRVIYSLIAQGTRNDLVISFRGRDDTITVRGWSPAASGNPASAVLGVELTNAPAPAPVVQYTAVGTAGNDNLGAALPSQHLTGLGGNDTLDVLEPIPPFDYYGFALSEYVSHLDGGDGDDNLLGGDGPDTIQGGDGSDLIHAGIRTFTTYTNWLEYWGFVESDARAFVDQYYPQTRRDADFNVVDAGTGDDIVLGGWGTDIVSGGDGIDRQFGAAGDDLLFGDGGDDQLRGDGNTKFVIRAAYTDAQGVNHPLQFDTSYTPEWLQGADLIDGGAGADLIAGDGNDDELYGGEGDDTLNGDSRRSADIADDAAALPYAVRGDDSLDGGAGNDVLYGDAGNDVLIGGVGNDRLWGDDTQDRLPGQYHGVDVLDGGDGDDELRGGGNADLLFGGAGADLMRGDDDELVLAASAHGDDEMDGGDGDDTLYGDGGNDVLIAGAGNDVLNGGSGDDTLIAGPGSDVLIGGGGNDTYLIASGGSNGSAQTQRVGPGGPKSALSAADSPGLVVRSEVDPPTVVQVLDAEGVNTAVLDTTADQVVMSVSADQRSLQLGYAVGDLVSVMDGLSGSVQSYGFADGTSVSFSELIGRYSPTVLRGQSELGFARAVGGLGDDTISTIGGLAILSGGRGNDILSAFGGNNTYRFSLGDERDSIEDHSGTDPASGQPWATSRIVFGSGIRPESITLSHSGALVFTFGADSTDELRVVGFNPANALAAPNIDQYVFDDGTVLTHAQLIARGFDLVGTAGNDSLSGTSVDDRFDGGAGNDTMTGGAGNDAYTWGPGAGIDVIDDGDATAGATDTLRVTAGLAPADLRLGRSGQDLVIAVRNGTEQVTVRNHFSNAGLEQMVFADGTTWNAADIAAHVTNELTDGDDSFTGTAGPDVINARGGNDTVSGAGGDDVIDGGTGNDTLNGDDGDDRLVGGAGTDNLSGGAGADTLDGRGDAANDGLSGGTGADVYLFGRGSGVDTINDGGDTTSVDVIRIDAGVAPADIAVTAEPYFFRINIRGTSDAIKLLSPESNVEQGKVERVEFADGTVWTAADVRQRFFDDAATPGNDLIRGFNTDDVIDGKAGNDTLYGNAGNDTLKDGETMYGGAGNDTYVLTAWNDATIYEYDEAGANTDALALPAGFSPAAIEVRRGYNSSTGGYDDLYLRRALGSYLVLPKYFYASNNDFKVEEIRFADGTVWSVPDVFANAVDSRTTEGADSILGFRWNDTIDARGGNDTINGYEGDDQLAGSGGDDIVYGGAGNDSLNGGTGNDTLYGDVQPSPALPTDGNDTLDGGAGNDTLYGGGGNDTFAFGREAGADFASDSGGTDRVLLAAGVLPTDVTLFRVGSDLVLAVDQSPTQLTVWGHFSGAASQVESIQFADGTVWDAAAILARTVTGTPNAMTGTAGNDTFVVDDVGDTITESVNQGIDTVQSSVHYTLGANLENLTLTGYLNINGDGNALDNTITGNTGNNVLDGGAGADTLSGGGGDDTYYVDSQSDVVTEAAGAGTDLVIATGDYTLPDNVENLRARYTWVYGNILIGNTLDNVITGDSSGHGNTFDGKAGADTMISPAGGGTFYVDSPGDVIVSGTPGSATAVDDVKSTIGYTLGPALENLELLTATATYGKGNERDNVLIGYNASTQSILLEGFGGGDTFRGGAASDTFVGGTGNDAYYVVAGLSTADQVVELPAEGNDTVIVSNGPVGSYAVSSWANVENATLADALGDSDLSGDANNNVLIGNRNANNLLGGGGDDVIDDDVYRQSGTYGLAPDFLSGGSGNDELNSRAGPDTLDGGTGDDLLGISNDAYASHSTVVFGHGYGADRIIASGANAQRRILFNPDVQPNELQVLRNGVDLQLSLGAGDVLTIANYFLDGTSTANNGLFGYVEFADASQLSAAALLNRLASGNVNVATAGDDALIGTTAADSLSGLAGNDALLGAGGNDALAGDGGDDALGGGDGDDDLTGGTGNDTLRGGSGNDTYRFARGDGQDAIIETAGTQDTIVFASGIATTDVNVTRSGDDLVLAISGGTDQITVQGFYLSAGGEIDAVRFADGTTWNSATLKDMASKIMGTAGADVLTGTYSNDQIFGLAGNDNINALDGNDLIDGGTGNDTMIGGLGDDVYVVDSTSDVVTEYSGEGTDTIQSSVTLTALAGNVENLTLTGTASINANGNSLANVLTGNSANNTLDGKAGADAMSGGAGNDTYVVDNTGDAVNENANEGTDLVQSSVTHTLGANVENLTLTGSNPINGTGNALDNVLTGNSGANTLSGGAGNDTYVYGSGDTITELAGEGIDTVQSSVTHTLGNHLENLTLTGSSAISATGNALDNVLTGNSGTNTLSGLAGNDTYYVGSGDTVTEAAGAGTDIVVSSVTWTLSSNVEVLTLSGSSAINGTGSADNNYLRGNSANNTLNGSGGNDVLQGLAGNDTVTDTSGKNALDGGDGTDSLTGGTASDFFAGGTGNDTLTLGGGADIVAFNRGHGADAINAPASGAGLNETNDTLSLGGARYADLRLARAGNDLYVKVAGTTDSVRFINWYAAAGNRTTTTLQMVVDSTADYNAGSSDPLVNKRVVRLNFTSLVNAFNTVYSGNPGIGDWAIPTATLSSAFSAGSDTQALGGDLAYRYGRDGNLSALDYATATTVLGNASFATAAQTFSASPTTGGVRLLGVESSNTATAQGAPSTLNDGAADTMAEASTDTELGTKSSPREIQRYVEQWSAEITATPAAASYLSWGAWNEGIDAHAEQPMAAASGAAPGDAAAWNSPAPGQPDEGIGPHAVASMWQRWRATDAALARLNRPSLPMLGGETFEARSSFSDLIDADRIALATTAKPRRPIVTATL